MKSFMIYIGILLIYLTTAIRVRSFQNIYINEVGIERTPQAIELVNISSASADISNWFIDDSGGTTYYTVPSNTVLFPNSCLVIEDDFNLNKSSPDSVRLFDATAPPTAPSAILIDSYSYKTGAGTSNSYQRSPDAASGWKAATSSLGQWNDTGVSCIIVPTATPTLEPSPSPADTPTTAPSPCPPSPTGSPATYEYVYISEVYPYPASNQKEWVELYNGNDFDITLADWFIDDIENGGGIPKRFTATITQHGYAVVEISGSFFNNEADAVRLLNPDKVQVDGFEYAKTQKEKSLGKISFESETVCIQEPSHGKSNNPCLYMSSSSSPTTSPITENPTMMPTPIRENERRQLMTSVRSNNSGSLPEVLGESTLYDSGNPPAESGHLFSSFVPISFSYSILTIVSLLVKIKNGLTA